MNLGEKRSFRRYQSVSHEERMESMISTSSRKNTVSLMLINLVIAPRTALPRSGELKPLITPSFFLASIVRHVRIDISNRSANDRDPGEQDET